MVLIGKKFKTSTGYKVEVFKVSEKGNVLSCYELNEKWDRIPEKKIHGLGYKVIILNKDKILTK
jgi:hypothetical protein